MTIATVLHSRAVYPIDLGKTRLQNQVIQKGVKPQYSGVLDAMRQVFVTEGPIGMYRGLFPQLAGVAFIQHQWKTDVWQQPDLEQFGRTWLYGYATQNGYPDCSFEFHHDGGKERFQPLIKQVKRCAAAVYPIDLGKTRLQNQVIQKGVKPQYSGVLDAMRQVFVTEGPIGMYRGLFPQLAGVHNLKIILTIITTSIYSDTTKFQLFDF